MATSDYAWYSEATTWANSRVTAIDQMSIQLAYFLLLFAITALVFALIYKYVAGRPHRVA
ncbi:MAG: hypothetical protein R2867_43375 [Caldilineaceae bacterium]